jgi:hypothetical protein
LGEEQHLVASYLWQVEGKYYLKYLPDWYGYKAGIASGTYQIGVGIRLVLPQVPTYQTGMGISLVFDTSQ